MRDTKHLHRHRSVLRGGVELPYSKSVLNRYLILAHLADVPVQLDARLLSDDTTLLMALLADPERTHYDCANAGTVIRFLTAYLALRQGQQIIDGSARMRKRPIGPLVEALREMGARIEYLGEEGYPPLRINSPGERSEGVLKMEGAVSSQFYTAIMLVSPSWPGGVSIEIPEDVVSRSYLDMTLFVLDQVRVKYERVESTLRIGQQPIQMPGLPPVRDWSSAAFFFVFAALAEEADLFFPGLIRDGVQGDEQICDITAHWGVEYREENGGARIVKRKVKLPKYLEIDLKSTPDLMPALAVLSASSGVALRCSGIEHLRYKESDRIEAMSSELKKGGVRLEARGDHLTIEGQFDAGGKAVFESWGDHRIAMALSLLSMSEEAHICNPEVVSKSFPHFWDQLSGV